MGPSDWTITRPKNKQAGGTRAGNQIMGKELGLCHREERGGGREGRKEREERGMEGKDKGEGGERD